MTNLFLLCWTSLCNNTFWLLSYLHVANSFKYKENNFIVSSFSLTTNYMVCELLTFLLSSLACLFMFEISISIHNTEDKNIWVHVFSPLCNFWRRQWHPTPALLPRKSHGRRSLVGCSPWGRKESDTTERLHFHFHALEKEMATHSSVLAWRIPGMREPGGLPSTG